LAKLAEQAILRAGVGSSVLVNDRVDVACAAGAAGVHLGENSLPPSEVRKLVNSDGARANFLIGVSAHSLDRALQAEQLGADYVIFGPVYTTPSKASFGDPQGVERLKEISNRLAIPVLAIGGITVENAGECVVAGAAGIAAIRLFQDAGDLDAVVRELRKVS
jgi:thiamine-phosphate pyrophosphorylase